MKNVSHVFHKYIQYLKEFASNLNCGELADFGLNSICKSRWNANWSLAPKWIAQEHILNDIASSVEQEVQAHVDGNMLTIAEEPSKQDQETSDGLEMIQDQQLQQQQQQQQQHQLLVQSSANSLPSTSSVQQQSEQQEQANQTALVAAGQPQSVDQQQQGVDGNSVLMDYNFTTLLHQALHSIDEKSRREKIQVSTRVQEHKKRSFRWIV